MKGIVETFYDSPLRSTSEEIETSSRFLSQIPYLQSILEGFPEIALVLDNNRQIVSCNLNAVKAFGRNSIDEILGKRVGEAILCIHRDEMGDNSCGTSQFCAECGAAHAIKFTRENLRQAIEECRITSEMHSKDESFDFKVVTTPINFSGKPFTLFAITDISGQKRKEALERIFFHDVLNTASVVNSISHLLEDADDNEFDMLLISLQDSTEQLISEVQTQRDLRNAEDGKLEVNIEPVSVNEIIESVYSHYANHELSKRVKIERIKTEKMVIIETDKRLLTRSLGNLAKNALEASQAGQKVTIYSITDRNKIKFCIKNEGIIPPDIQLQIFQRSFSTKGEYGRGIGTYSVKLLVEQYLGGEVFFTSNERNGTVFNILLNK